MQLILMRHGIAAPPESEIRPIHTADAARPLTATGLARTRQAAQGLLAQVSQLDLVATSPKLRASQTAEAIALAFGPHAPPAQIWTELQVPDWEALDARVADAGAQAAVLVGHEPWLGQYASYLLTGTSNALPMQLKKAGACALEGDFATGQWRLLWLLRPAQLRSLGRAGVPESAG